MDFWCFLAISELMSDSLTTTQVKPNQCPSHQSILLTQTNPWKFHEKILRIGGAGKWGLFEAAILILFLLHISEKPSPFIWGIIFFLHYERFFQNLGKEGWRTFMHTTVFRWNNLFLILKNKNQYWHINSNSFNIFTEFEKLQRLW